MKGKRNRATQVSARAKWREHPEGRGSPVLTGTERGEEDWSRWGEFAEPGGDRRPVMAAGSV